MEWVRISSTGSIRSVPKRIVSLFESLNRRFAACRRRESRAEVQRADISDRNCWKRDKLVEIIRKIEGNIMIEFKRNGDNTIASNRIPVFVGEFIYDEEKESFIRNGRGYWIDEETRIATREVEWKDGVEVSGRDLVDGWYTRFFTISSVLFYTNG